MIRPTLHPPSPWTTLLVRPLGLILMLLAPLLAAAQPLEAVRIADGVYAFIGSGGDIDAANRGRIANAGFIVGPRGVAVIDTGVSHEHGLAQLEAIRRVTALPVERVILTHAVQEFLYGTTAFADAGASLLCHRKSADLMRARCEHCLSNLRQILGEDVMAGTRLIIPHDVVDGDTTIDVGGRRLELLAPGWASTPGDLMVLDIATGVLFSGGVLSNGRVPELRDGKLKDWVTSIDRLAPLPLTAIVPGHGPPMAPARAADTRDYLLSLEDHVQRLYGRGMSLMEAVEAADLPAFSRWGAYGSLHRKNLQQRYLELEVEELDR